jgi:putative Holliday junction resolvase
MGMKYLGVDYGAKRVGIAVSDAAGMIAFPRTTIENGSDIVARIARLVAEERAEVIIVGDTRSFSGRENEVTKESDEFAGRLREATGLPVHRVSEVHSSVEASRYSPDGNAHDDSAAAAFILQRYLDMKGNTVR